MLRVVERCGAMFGLMPSVEDTHLISKEVEGSVPVNFLSKLSVSFDTAFLSTTLLFLLSATDLDGSSFT